MQFKETGNKIQVLAYTGYDKVKRRAIVSMLGSFDKHDLTPSAGLMDKLTAKQKEELQSYIERLKQYRKLNARLNALSQIDSQLEDAAAAIEQEERLPSEEQAARIWRGIQKLSKVLRKAGFKKPPRATRKATGASSDGQQPLSL